MLSATRRYKAAKRDIDTLIVPDGSGPQASQRREVLVWLREISRKVRVSSPFVHICRRHCGDGFSSCPRRRGPWQRTCIASCPNSCAFLTTSGQSEPIQHLAVCASLGSQAF